MNFRINAVFALRELIDSPSLSAVDHLTSEYPRVSASADKYVPADKYDVALRRIYWHCAVFDYKSARDSRLPSKIGN